MIRVPFWSKLLFIGLLLTCFAGKETLSQCSPVYPFDPHCSLSSAGLNEALTPVHVPDNATLKFTSVVDHQNAVFRDGFYSRGDAGPPLLYTGLVGNCVANGLLSDEGSCVDVDVSAGGGSWKASFPVSGIDPAQFGAPINNTGDASIGINRAINYIRSTGVGGARFASGLNLGGSERRYRILNPLNFTCLSDRTLASGCAVYQDSGDFNVISNGAQIYCFTTAKACLDGLGSEFVRFNDGSVTTIGDCGSFKPKYGLQMGRTTPLKDAGFWSVGKLRFEGCFANAPYYNGAGEVVTVTEPAWFNNQNSGTSYGAILDCDNHWNISSDFVTVTTPVDVPNSFNDMIIRGGSIGAAGGASTSNAIWACGTNRLVLDKVFLRANNNKCFTIWNDGVNASSFPHALKVHAHCEHDVSLANWFYFTSKNAGSTITADELEFDDYDNRAATAIFSKDANTVSIQMLGERLNIINYIGTPALFDTPSAYTITNPGNDYISASVVGWAPSPSCTGLGTGGACVLRYGTAGAGSIRMTTGTGSPAGFGNITLSFGMNLGLNKAMCQWTLVTPGDAGGTFWSAPGAGVIAQGVSPSAPIYQWQNSGLSPLPVSSHVDLDYLCRGL